MSAPTPEDSAVMANGMVRPGSCPTSEARWTRGAFQEHAEVAVIGIDIGKNTFHAIGLNQRGAIVLRQKWSRRQAAERLDNLPPCLIGMQTHSVEQQREGWQAILDTFARYIAAKARGLTGEDLPIP